MAEVRSVEEKLRNELTLNARLRGRDKGARRSNRKPLACLRFWRAGRSGRVPRLAF